MLDVSVVVCVRDVAPLLPPCLESVCLNEPREIIVVDGLSRDDSVAIARRFTPHVLQDGGRGLAFARNLGINAATGTLIAFVGPDNVLPAGALELMRAEKMAHGWTGVSAVTRVHAPSGYLANSMDRYKSYRFKPGERTVIGTPSMFDATDLRLHMFDDAVTSSDDADLCERLTRAGATFGISTAVVYEQGTTDARSMLSRWRWYGRSDAEFFRMYSPGWSWPRRVSSLLHPLRAELLGPAHAALAQRDVAILPFLTMITLIRYAGWIEASTVARHR